MLSLNKLEELFWFTYWLLRIIFKKHKTLKFQRSILKLLKNFIKSVNFRITI
jgi:hypothetical protein